MTSESKAFSQFRGGTVEHRGRTATLKAVAYTSAEETTDERNGRQFDFTAQGKNERVLFSVLFVPMDAPKAFQRENFASLKEHQQFVFSSLARHEEKQRKGHKGDNQRGKSDPNPIISRHDVALLDKRLYLLPDGNQRPDGLNNLKQVMTDFIRENYTRKGLIASFSIHDQDPKGGTANGNFHAHIVSNYRALNADGWGERMRPYKAGEWRAWRGHKAHSLAAIQTCKLVRLGAIEAAPSRSHQKNYEVINQGGKIDGKQARRNPAARGTFNAGQIAKYIARCSGQGKGGKQRAERYGRYSKANGGGALPVLRALDAVRTIREDVGLLSSQSRYSAAPQRYELQSVRGKGMGGFRCSAAAATGRDVTSLIFAKYSALIEQARREGKHDTIAALKQRCDDEVKAAEKQLAQDRAAMRKSERRIAQFQEGKINSF